MNSEGIQVLDFADKDFKSSYYTYDQIIYAIYNLNN